MYVRYYRFIKSQYAGKRGSHSIKSQMDNKNSDKSESRSCAMSDTSEAPSLGKNKNKKRQYKLKTINKKL